MLAAVRKFATAIVIYLNRKKSFGCKTEANTETSVCTTSHNQQQQKQDARYMNIGSFSTIWK